MTRTLLLIFAFIALMIGSFIWFVATWDRDAEQPVSQRATPPASSWPIQLPPEGLPATSPDATAKTASGSDPYRTHTGPISNPYGVL